LDCCKDGIIVTGPNHDIQFINHAIEKLLGFRLEDVLGKSAHDLQRSDSFKADIVESINMQVNKGKVFSLFSLFFIRCMKKNYLNYEFILCEGMGRNYFPQKKIW
jgi:PAS domain-containing protein